MSGKSKPSTKSSRGAVAKAIARITEQNVRSIAELEKAEHANQTMSDRIATLISHFCGSMLFFWVHVAGFTLWIIANVGWFNKPFDPFPFSFLTLVVSLEAIFLSTFIMIAENRQERTSERRSQLDLQIDLLAEQEGTKTLQLLEAIAKKLGLNIRNDPTISALEQATKPEDLVRQIEQEHDPENGKPHTE